MKDVVLSSRRARMGEGTDSTGELRSGVGKRGIESGTRFKAGGASGVCDLSGDGAASGLVV